MGKNYLQSHGTAMGTIFMENIKTKILSQSRNKTDSMEASH